MSNSRLLVNSVDAPKKRQMPVLGHSDYYLKNQICSMDECFNIWNRSGRSVSAYLALKESMAHCWLSGLHWRKSPCLITINRSDGLKGIMKCCLNFQWNSNFIGTFYLTVSEFPLLYAVHNWPAGPETLSHTLSNVHTAALMHAFHSSISSFFFSLFLFSLWCILYSHRGYATGHLLIALG